MNGDEMVSIFVWWIVPILMGIGIYYGSEKYKYDKINHYIDRFANWLHIKRESIKEDKSSWKYIKYTLVPFDLLMRLTGYIKNNSIRNGVRITLSIYLFYIVGFVALVVTIVLIGLVLLLIGLLILGAASSLGGGRGDYSLMKEQIKESMLGPQKSETEWKLDEMESRVNKIENETGLK